jgi:HPt (histidine-containing phosphotransfer) domain-containing protein
MSLRHSYRQTANIVRQWPSESRPLLAHLCSRIQDAERKLNTAAALRLKGCLKARLFHALQKGPTHSAAAVESRLKLSGGVFHAAV